MEDANDDFQSIQDVVNVKTLLKNHTQLNDLVYKKFNKFIHSSEQVMEILSLFTKIDSLNQLSAKIKLPVDTSVRLADILVFSLMEAVSINHRVHTTFRQ